MNETIYVRDPKEDAAEEGRLSDLKRDLLPTVSRLLARRSAISVASLLSLIEGYADRYPTVKVQPLSEAAPNVAVCSHDLYFAIGTALHHLGLAGRNATIYAEGGDSPAIILQATVPTETEEETAAVFGLDLEDRALLLTQLAEEAGFTLSLAVGERCALRFGLSCGRADHVRLLAVTDPSLLAAFLLPLTYFHY